MRELPRYVYNYPSRHGKDRYYFHRKGEQKIRLTAAPGTAEFTAQYEAALAGEMMPAPRKQRRQPTVPEVKRNTLRWLCTEYMDSEAFTALNPRTRHVRRQIIEHCLNEPTEPGGKILFADVPVDLISTKAIRTLRDRKRGLPEAANGRVKAFRQVFKWALEEEVSDLVTSNPARDVEYKRSGSQGHHSWTLEEVEQFERRHPIGSRARLALALLLYTAQRRSDIVRLGHQHVKNGWLRFTQAKNKDRKPVTLELPMLPELKRIIGASPVGIKTFLVTEFGKPFTPNGFGNWFRDRCIEAGVPGRAHGLRKAAAARMAELGCTPHEIMSITGHVTIKEIERYTRGVRQKALAEAAMNRMAKAAE